MDYLGDKLAVAQTHMTQWMGTVRRSFQDALNLVTTTVGHERAGGEPASRTPFKRTSSFRHLASRSRESLRRFSARSQQRFSSLRKRQPDAEPPDLVSLLWLFNVIRAAVTTPPLRRPPPRREVGRLDPTREVASSDCWSLRPPPVPVPAPGGQVCGAERPPPPPRAPTWSYSLPRVVGEFILDSVTVWMGGSGLGLAPPVRVSGSAALQPLTRAHPALFLGRISWHLLHLLSPSKGG